LLLATIIGFATLVPLAPPASAAPGSYYLNVTGQSQQKSNWCWAATGNSIAAFYGKSYSQNQFCNLAFGNSQNATCPNNQATLANDQQAFRSIGISAGSYVSSTLGFSTVVSEIAAGRPVMTRIGWSSGGGHMMDIIGYDSSDSTIEYYNPWPDDPRYNYSTYTWYRSNSQFTWTHSLYRIGA
jgi:hypothetical protein